MYPVWVEDWSAIPYKTKEGVEGYKLHMKIGQYWWATDDEILQEVASAVLQASKELHCDPPTMSPENNNGND
jgi:hypothetical protein